MITRQPVVKDVTLVARSAEDQLQSGSADVQSFQHIDAVVPLLPNSGSRTWPRPLISHYDAVCQLLRSTLTDTLLRLFGIHYQKLSSVVTLLLYLSLG